MPGEPEGLWRTYESHVTRILFRPIVGGITRLVSYPTRRENGTRREMLPFLSKAIIFLALLVLLLLFPAVFVFISPGLFLIHGATEHLFPKDDLGLENFKHVHNAVLRQMGGKLYVIAQAWNPGDFVILEQVTP